MRVYDFFHFSESVQQFRRVCSSFGECATVSERVQHFRSECSRCGECAGFFDRFRRVCSILESVQHFGECAARLAYIHRIPGLSTKV